MLVVSMLRIFFDVGILYLFVSMSKPRQDHQNPFCLMLQYTSFPFGARLFPDFVTMGAISVHQKAMKDVQGPKAILPLRAEIVGLATNETVVGSFMVIRDSTFKSFLNMSILMFMYLGTLLTWAAVRQAPDKRVETVMMRKIFQTSLYFFVFTSWMFCNTESISRMYRTMMNNRFGSSLMINCFAWTFLAITIRVTYHCIQLIPPQTSSQCNLLQNYVAILNICVWYSFVALYFAYDFYKPVPLLLSQAIRLDENLLVSLLFLFSFIFAPPYRYRLPIPAIFQMRNLGGSLPELQERFRTRERAVREIEEQYVELKMDTVVGIPPPAYEAA